MGHHLLSPQTAPCGRSRERCLAVLPPQPLLNEHRGDRAIILIQCAGLGADFWDTAVSKTDKSLFP